MRVSGADYFRTGGIASSDAVFAKSGMSWLFSGAGNGMERTLDAPRFLPAGGMTSMTTTDARGNVIPSDILTDREAAS